MFVGIHACLHGVEHRVCKHVCANPFILRVVEQLTVGFVLSGLQWIHACLRAVEQLIVGFVRSELFEIRTFSLQVNQL